MILFMTTKQTEIHGHTTNYNYRWRPIVETLYRTSHEPKTLELEITDDGRLRLILTLKKLGFETKLEYFLDQEEAKQLGEALKG